MKIFIVEDDKNIKQLLCEELAGWDYTTRGVEDFNHVLEEFLAFAPELVLMDISLPYYNGYYWTQQIRNHSTVPIIVISSHTEPIDMVQAMQFGADDYITKPIDIAVTRAKIQAVLRRTYAYVTDSDKLIFGNCSLHLRSAKLECAQGSVELSKTELLILESLFLAKGQIAKREKIIDHCWQSEQFIDDNTLAVNITRIRKKLATLALSEFIQTKKGIGYYLQ